MDINDMQQINTFVKGMNTDTSDALLSPELYRFAKNLRLTTGEDSNSGELHMIEGNIPAGVLDNIDISDKNIIAATSIRKYGIIIAKDNSSWYIYRFTKEKNSGELLFGPCNEPIWDNENNKINLLVRYESDNNIKLYIVDGIHDIMLLEISHTPTPGNIPNKISYLTGYTNVLLQPLLTNVSSLAGLLYPAKVLYAYRLYSKKGAVTKLSTLSSPLSLYKTSNSGYSSTEKTGRSVEISIPDISYYDGDSANETLDYILIFRITYRENGQTPEIKLVKDLKYESSATLIDTGSNDIMSISISEFLSYSYIGIIPKIIESKNDYLFAANVKYKLDEVNDIFKDIDVTTPDIAENGMSGDGDYFNWELFVDETPGGEYTISQDYLAPSYAYLTSSFRPGETYRFGIILYDKDGNGSSVKHMCDITIPDYFLFNNLININKNINGDLYSPTYTVHPIRIRIKLNQVIPNCSGYEVVRCIRTMSDKRTISQGIIGHPLLMYNYNYNGGSPIENATDKICPSGFFTKDQMLVHNGGKESWNNAQDAPTITCKPIRNVLLFASPEYAYQGDDIKDILLLNSDNIKIHEIAAYGCLTKNQGALLTSILSDTTQLNKMAFRFFVRNINNDDIGIENSNTLLVSSKYNTIYLGGYNEGLLYERNNKTGNIMFNYIQPYEYSNNYGDEYAIKKIAYPNVPKYNTLSLDNVLRFLDDVTQIGPYLFIGWSAPCVLEENIGTESDLAKLWNGSKSRSEDIGSFYGVGTTGRCILMQTENDLQQLYGTFRTITSYQGESRVSGLFNITVADIRKEVEPYGGDSEVSKKNSVYYSFGEVFSNDLNYKTITCGDCYIRLFLYNALHNWFDTTYVCPRKMGTVYSIPLFTDIDLHGLFGQPFNSANNKQYYIQDEPVSFDDYVQTNSAYLYNTAYNAYPDIISHSSYVKENKDSNYFDTRIHYSELKINGEDMDSWLLFKSNNFLDVDSRYGEITNLRLFKDRLIFWQNNATGLLSVNERVVLQDANATLVVLGTGSVLERYDYFTTVYGMKPNQMADTLSNESLYWWDGYNKEILLYAEKYAVTPLSTIKFIKNYINNYDENNNPHLVYDNKNKEIIVNCVNNESVVYNESIQAFTAVYSFEPKFSLTIDDSLYTINEGGQGVSSFASDLWILNKNEGKNSKLYGINIYPSIEYIVNHNNTYVKTFDILTFGGRIYGGEEDGLRYLQFTYTTPLKQIGKIENGKGISNREYDFRLNIPRHGKYVTKNGNNIWVSEDYGDRLKGKTMQCELRSTSNSDDFSLQYIITKYRMSWS